MIRTHYGPEHTGVSLMFAHPDLVLIIFPLNNCLEIRRICP